MMPGRFAFAVLILGSVATAQDSFLDKVQLHGAISQGFLFSSSNNFWTTDSSDGSFRWNEALINLAVPLTDNLRVSVQVHSYSLGQFGQQKVNLDFA